MTPEIEALLERLRATMRTSLDLSTTFYNNPDGPAAADTIEALTRELAVKDEALRPFVQHYAPWMDEWPDEDEPASFSRVTFGQLRAALAALTPKASADEQEIG